MSYFQTAPANIEGNKKLRLPQIDAYLKIKNFFEKDPKGEALVVLPTGTGKSGLISIAPFRVSKSRVLVVSPGLVTQDSVIKTMESVTENFWLDQDIFFDPEMQPIVIEYNKKVSYDDLCKAHFVVVNVQKTDARYKSALLNKVAEDHFDMIIVDEAHHAVAKSWKNVFDFFKDAKRLYLTGTPYRGDNQEVPGKLIHRTGLSEVMKNRYVKFLRKQTVDHSELYFTMDGDESTKYSCKDVLKLKNEEWLSRAVTGKSIDPKIYSFRVQ